MDDDNPIYIYILACMINAEELQGGSNTGHASPEKCHYPISIVLVA